MTFTRADAERIARAIEENVQDMYAERISFEEFGSRQHKLWAEVAQGEQNIIGSVCDKRHTMVCEALKAIGSIR